MMYWRRSARSWLPPERKARMRGGFGGGFRGGFRGGGFGMRRGGFPLLGMGMGFGMGPLMTGLMAGGLGYLLGSNNNQAAEPAGVSRSRASRCPRQPGYPGAASSCWVSCTTRASSPTTSSPAKRTACSVTNPANQKADAPASAFFFSSHAGFIPPPQVTVTSKVTVPFYKPEIQKMCNNGD